MPSREEDPVGYRRQRNYHRDRALVAKALREEQLPRAAQLSQSVLWTILETCIRRALAEAADGRNPKLAETLEKARACAAELELRGVQLELPLTDQRLGAGQEIAGGNNASPDRPLH